MTDPVPLVFTVEEAAKLLRVSRGSAYEAVRAGELPAVRIGRRCSSPDTSLTRWSASKTAKAPSATGPPRRRLKWAGGMTKNKDPRRRRTCARCCGQRRPQQKCRTYSPARAPVAVSLQLPDRATLKDFDVLLAGAPSERARAGRRGAVAPRQVVKQLALAADQ